MLINILFGVAGALLSGLFSSEANAQVCRDYESNKATFEASCQVANVPCSEGQGILTSLRTRNDPDGSLIYECFQEFCNGSPSSVRSGMVAGDPGCGDRRAKKQSQDSEKNCPAKGSIIQVENRVLGEQIPLVGATFGLSYFTNRVLGRKADYTYTTQLTGPTIPANLTATRVIITNSAGAVIKDISYPAAINQTDTQLWDGKNPAGQLTWASEAFNVTSIEIRSSVSNYEVPAQSHIAAGNLKAIKLGVGGWMVLAA